MLVSFAMLVDYPTEGILPTMKTIALVAVLILMTALPSLEQNRGKALTVEECRAAAKLYGKDEAVDLPTSKRLALQSEEMKDCETKTDRVNWQQYHALSDKFLMAISLRQSDFISRHKLDAQFVTEDEEGMR